MHPRAAKMGCSSYNPFGGVCGAQRVLHPYGMDRSREFWLRLGVIGGALILMSFCDGGVFQLVVVRLGTLWRCEPKDRKSNSRSLSGVTTRKSNGYGNSDCYDNRIYSPSMMRWMR